MPNPLDRAATEALLEHAEVASLYLDGMAATAHENAQSNIRGVSRLIVDLVAALRAAHAALDGATVERVCACGHDADIHYEGQRPLCEGDGDSVCRCAAFTPTHERVTVMRALVVPE